MSKTQMSADDSQKLVGQAVGVFIGTQKRKGNINLQYWDPGPALYGSAAYIEYGQEEELAWERNIEH